MDAKGSEIDHLTEEQNYQDLQTLNLSFGMVIVHFRFLTSTIMKNNILFLLISGFILVSCTKERIKIDPDHPLIGLWNYSNNQGDIQVFSRDLHFLEIHGYKFNADGTLLERMIEGFCATPPVRYTNYDGTWSPINDSIIDIFVKYWGGTEHYRLVILSATSDSLKFIAQVNN